MRPLLFRKIRGSLGVLLFCLFALALSACSLEGRSAEAQGAAASSGSTGVDNDCEQPGIESAVCTPALPGPAASLPAAGLPSSPIGPAADPSPSALPQSTAASDGSSPAQPMATPTPCAPDLCIYTGQLILARPVSPPGRDSVDTSYRFGTTQGGQRDPHHGVEFLNSAGTPVLAAADGEVILAGDDRQVLQGPYSYFYGNLVILKHALPGLSQPLYTLYAHLSQVSVAAGDRVQAGQVIGQVGMSGVATGSHLHFEVRYGENSYASSRNPELWLAPRLDVSGQPLGALAGRILDAQGDYLAIENIVLEHLPAPDRPADLTLYLGTYAEKALVGQPPWRESFAVGDLPAGWYRVSFVQSGMQQHLVQVLPGQLTVVTFRPEDPD